MNTKKQYRVGGIDIPYLIISILIIAIGFLTMISAYSGKSFEGMDYREAVFKFALRQIGYLGFGVACAVAACRLFHWSFYQKIAVPFYGVMLVLMVLTAIFGKEIYGAKRWFLGIQPSEIVKISLIFVMAKYIAEWPKKQRMTFLGSLQMLIFVVPMAIIAVLGQRHLSVTIIFLMITALMLLVSGVNRWLIVAGGGAGVLGVICIILFGAGFRGDRIQGWLHPFSAANKTGASWQVVQSLYAIASGGLFGRGYTQSREKYAWLPMADNDYIFSVFAEEFGYVACVLMIILFGVFIWRGIVIASRAPNVFLTMVAFGITMMFAVQILLNICIVCNVLPSTGIQLPFFSSGGTSLIVSVASVGLVLNVSKYRTK